MYSDAIQYLDKSIALSNATPGAPYPFLPLLAKADSLALTGQTAEAQKIINGMLESARNRNATMYEVNTLQTMARIHRASNDIGGAIGDLDLSIRLSEKSGYTRASVESQIDLADIYGSRGDLRKAEALLVSATTAAQKNGELYTLPQRLEILAELQVRQGKFGEADRTYDRAAAFVDANIGNDSAVLDKTALIKSVSDLYVGHFGVLAEHLDNPAKAYAVVEQVRGRVMSDLLLGGSAAPLKAQQNERAIARLRLRMMGATSTTEVEKFRDQISGLEQARWVTPEVSILKSRSYSHVPLREVQGALSSNATILEYVLADPISWCLVIRRHSANIVRLRGKQQIETAISSYLKTLKKKQVDPAAARDLYAALIQPVRQAGQAGDLMIVRDGLLNLLPFDALNEPSGDYVGERNVISYLPSAGTFYLLARQTARPNQNRKVLAVGGVPYDQAAEHFKNLIASQGFAATDLANLQNSREEATTATAGASEADKNLLVGSAATEAAVKKVAGESYRVIHLAVHSAVDTNRPDRAALILLDDPTAGEDGLLQGQEIAQMHLRTSLVVLSACDTAVGPIEGQEGVATLARSFLLAGAQNVISTLWAADDNSSLAVLKQFYAHLATGESAALSLAEAKRDFLAKFGPKAVPYYWAAFTFEGVPNTATILYDQERNTH
jgi:CHAT domain-containing protein